MLTRPQQIALIMEHAARSPELASEISYHVHDIGDREYAYDEVSAVFDIEDHEGTSRALRTTVRRALIAIGFYRPMSEDEINNTFVSSGTPWAFKLDKVAYTHDDPAEEWQWPVP
jgi:hypothetical protein